MLKYKLFSIDSLIYEILCCNLLSNYGYNVRLCTEALESSFEHSKAVLRNDNLKCRAKLRKLALICCPHLLLHHRSGSVCITTLLNTNVMYR